MFQFKPINISDREILQKYLNKNQFITCEYSFLTLYIWRKMYQTEYCISDDILIIRKFDKEIGNYYMQPIGFSNLDSLKNIIFKLRKFNERYKNLFGDIETPFSNKLKDIFGNSIVVSEHLNHFDYIYNSDDLISLSGRKFHRKKNQYNKFINNYKFKIKNIITSDVINDCINFSKNWYRHKDILDDLLKYEENSIVDVLQNINFLALNGIAVYVDDIIVGFCLGERVNKNMAIIHFEKGDTKYSGIYAFMTKTIIETYFNNIELINKQEDLGNAGLRKAKMAYQPIKLEKKFTINFI